MPDRGDAKGSRAGRRSNGSVRSSRCAIYTRKSSEEGLEQDFNSLQAQREACEAYCLSQRHEGWAALPGPYDDGGISGGTMERPALRRLIADIEAGLVDIVVVYKVDRLTRSLSDFARMVEIFDRNRVSFVSVTQQFNTTSSMGRLTLNVLLSFAQFEREVTAERIRDKIAASKAKGMWMGGFVPLGYDASDRTLTINEPEAETVRTICRLYLELGNVRRLKDELDRRDFRTKAYVTKTGRRIGGLPFSRGHLYRILSNPIYIGEIDHKGKRHKGQHPAIIDRKLWDDVQAQLRSNGHARRIGRNAKEPSLLAGLLHDGQGNRLTPTHAVKSGRRYRYYARVRSHARGKDENCWKAYRIAATGIEPVVIDQIAGFLRDASRLTAELGLEALPVSRQTEMTAAASRLAMRVETESVSGQREILLDVVQEIRLGDGRLRIRLDRSRLVEALSPGDDEAGLKDCLPGDGSIELHRTITFARRGVETKLVIEDQSDTSRRAPDPVLIKTVARGHHWFDLLASGKARTLREIASAEGVSERYVARLIPLAFLAPPLIEAILEGRQPVTLDATNLMAAAPLPLGWREQVAVIGRQPSFAKSEAAV
ncbi:recombinase family protein [Microbaculum sp. FT89]|uniref:recombinase family protein n=1 Tax=Microbaculum sp. FT89 TaxID=3447298 RepID=UPI003F53B965